MQALPATLLLFAAGCLHHVIASAAEPDQLHADWPVIALIIDDLGNQRLSGQRAVSLPGPVACSFFPFAAHTRELATMAHAHGKEVMLHLPMQAEGHFQEVHEAGVLTIDMTQHQFRDTFNADVAAVPYVSGLNNHMGSLLTQHPGDMAWLMQLVKQYGRLFFIDSRTTAATVARETADEYGISASQRNVFLDDVEDTAAIHAQFRRLLSIARREGSALAIGHPHTATLDVLADEIGQLDREHVRLVRVAELIRIQQTRIPLWQMSLSPWHRAARNSKRLP